VPVKLSTDFEPRLARLSKDLNPLQRSVQELLATFEQPPVDRRTRNPVDAAQYAMLEAALRTPEAKLVAPLDRTSDGSSCCPQPVDCVRAACRSRAVPPTSLTPIA